MSAERSLACARCGGSMEVGFVIDEGYATRTVAKWVEGEPEPSFWSGLKTSDRGTADIRTYRCSRCGYLESYA